MDDLACQITKREKRRELDKLNIPEKKVSKISQTHLNPDNAYYKNYDSRK
jgi:hypothetical protein